MVDGTRTPDLPTGGAVIDVIANTDSGAGSETRRVPIAQFAADIAGRISDDIAPGVISILNAPPGSPTNGDRYLVGMSPTGDFAGKANYIAKRISGAWSLVAPAAGMTVFNIAESLFYYYDAVATAWKVSGNPPILRDTRANLLLVTGQPTNTPGYVLGDPGIATVDWSRTSNVVTVNLASAHGVSVGDNFALAGLATSAFNGLWVAVSGTAGSALKFAHSGADVGSTADTGGKLVLNGAYNFNGTAWKYVATLDAYNPVAGQTPIYMVSTAPTAVGKQGFQIYVTDEVDGRTIAVSDNMNWRRVSDGAVISSWVDSDLLVSFDPIRNRYYWNGAIRALSEVTTDHGDGSYTLDGLSLGTNFIVIHDYYVPDWSATCSGTLVSFTNSANDRLELPAYEEGILAGPGLMRHKTRLYSKLAAGANYSTFDYAIGGAATLGMGRRRIGFVISNGSTLLKQVDNFIQKSSDTSGTYASLTKMSFGRRAYLTGDVSSGFVNCQTRVYALTLNAGLFDLALARAQLETLMASDSRKPAIHFLGDSFLNLGVLPESVMRLVQTQHYVPFSYDGVGGSYLGEQATRYTGASPVSRDCWSNITDPLISPTPPANAVVGNGATVRMYLYGGGQPQSPSFWQAGDVVDIAGFTPSGYNAAGVTLTGAGYASDNRSNQYSYIEYANSTTATCTAFGTVEMVTPAGSKISYQSKWFASRVAIVDGGFDQNGYLAELAIRRVQSVNTSGEPIVYVQSNPQVPRTLDDISLVAGSGTLSSWPPNPSTLRLHPSVTNYQRWAWDQKDAQLQAFLGDNHVKTLQWMQGGSDGSWTDEANIRNGLWPVSMMADGIHPSYMTGHTRLATRMRDSFVRLGWL